MKLTPKEPLHFEHRDCRGRGFLLYCASEQQLHSFERLTGEVMPFNKEFGRIKT